MLFDFNGFKILMVIFEIVLEAGIWMRAGRGMVRGRLGWAGRGRAPLLVKTNFEVYLEAKLNFAVRSYSSIQEKFEANS